MTVDVNKIAAEAVRTANDIEAVLQGRDTAASYMALAMVIGAAEAKAKEPDLHGLMRIIAQQAFYTFLDARKGARNG